MQIHAAINAVQVDYVLKHLCPKKSFKHYLNHSKSGLFLQNHQTKVMQSLR